MAGATADQVLRELNEVRANPSAYSKRMAELLPRFRGTIYHLPGKIDLQTNEGPAAVQDCIKELQGTRPLPLFSISQGMNRAAQDHCDECGPIGHTGHDGPNGSTMDSRISSYGEWSGGIGENISYGNTTAADIVQQLLIDDGLSSRGHRRNILNPKFLIVGIGAGAHSDMEYMCTIDFAQEYTEGTGSAPVASRCPPMRPPKGAHEPPVPSHPQGDPDTSDWPEGAVGLRTQTSESTKGHQRITKITKIYTMEDGSTATEEETRTETI